MKEVREKIDEADNEIMNALRKRFAVARIIGAEKRKKKIEIRDTKREEQIISTLIQKNKDIGAGFIAELYDLILSESRRMQEP